MRSAWRRHAGTIRSINRRPADLFSDTPRPLRNPFDRKVRAGDEPVHPRTIGLLSAVPNIVAVICHEA